MARPTLLTPEVQEDICNNIRLGAKPEEAATLAGIDESTYYRWMQRGAAELRRINAGKRVLKMKPSEAPYCEFCKAIKKVKAEFKRTLITRILRAGTEEWQPNAWMLERRFPNEYGQKVLVRQQVEQELEAALDRLERELDDETLAKVLRVIAGGPGDEAAGNAAGDERDAPGKARAVRVDAAL